MSKFSLARAAGLGVASKAAPRCIAHANSACASVFPALMAIAEMTGSSNCPSFHSVTQWRESQKHNALFFAKFQKLRLRQIECDSTRTAPCLGFASRTVKTNLKARARTGSLISRL
jgi:hypothetical protein